MTTSNVNPDDDAKSGESKEERYAEARLDAAFDVLSDARRRRVIRILRANSRERTTVRTLAAELADCDANGTSTAQLVVSLRHVHLPRLSTAGVIEYTPDRSRVRYTGNPLVERLLDQL